MSVIIGCVRKGKVFLATDSQRTWGNVVTHAQTAFGANVLRMPEGVLVGAACNQAVKRGIAAHPEWFSELKGEPLTKRYVMERIVPELYRETENLGEIDERAKERGSALYNGIVLLAQGDRLFCIDGDFSVQRIEDYCLIGHGSEYAVPRVRRLYRKDLSDGETATLFGEALSDAAIYSSLSSAPFKLYDTATIETANIGG